METIKTGRQWKNTTGKEPLSSMADEETRQQEVFQMVLNLMLSFFKNAFFKDIWASISY